MPWIPSVCVLAALAIATPSVAAPVRADASASLISRALADPARAAQRGDDGLRHPAELVALADLRPGARVLDLIPGSGYWTRIFSEIVGPTGRVYAVWPQAYAKLAAGNVATLRAMSASKDYANVVTLVEPTTTLSSPEPLDLVWTSQNYHDYADPFMGSPGPQSLARDAYLALKPGGRFVIIDHQSLPGHSMADTDTLHRIDPAIVKTQVEAVGFRYVGHSDVLKNPADPLNIPVFDKAIRGHTSQFAFVFRKPS